jgi:hypothetical protein
MDRQRRRKRRSARRARRFSLGPRGYQPLYLSMAPFHFWATHHGATILLPGRRDASCRDGCRNQADRTAMVQGVHDWLRANRLGLPGGFSEHRVPIQVCRGLIQASDCSLGPREILVCRQESLNEDVLSTQLCRHPAVPFPASDIRSTTQLFNARRFPAHWAVSLTG